MNPFRLRGTLILANALIATLVCVTSTKGADGPNRDAQLIIACYRVEVAEVVKLLRAGADVHAKLGRKHSDEVMDKWTGGTYVSSRNWTALLALAHAQEYPDPPQDVSKVWEDRERVRREQKLITDKVLMDRRRDELTIGYLLLSHGAKLDRDDGYGATALYAAVSDGKPLLVRALLEFGANPNTKCGVYIDGPSDITPLHNAANSAELFQLLLDYKADAFAKNSAGYTPLDLVLLHRNRNFDVETTSGSLRVVPRKGLERKE